MEKIIKSKNFILRPYKKEDEKSLTNNINNKSIYRYTLRIPYPYTLKDAKQWISHCQNLAKKKRKTDVVFAIDINGSVVGNTSLMNIDSHKAEIGYWIGKKYWGRGIATEVVRLITIFGFNKLKLKRIYALVFVKNKASARVLEKNGYKREGLMKKYCIKDEKLTDVISYAKVR